MALPLVLHVAIATRNVINELLEVLCRACSYSAVWGEPELRKAL